MATSISSVPLNIPLVLLLLLCILSIDQACSISSVHLQQSTVGQRSGGFAGFVFEVAVTNRCRCAVANVTVASEGFISDSMVDPKVFRLDGDAYLLNDGKGIESSQCFKFQYQWNHYFRMAPKSFQASC